MTEKFVYPAGCLEARAVDLATATVLVLTNAEVLAILDALPNRWKGTLASPLSTGIAKLHTVKNAYAGRDAARINGPQSIHATRLAKLTDDQLREISDNPHGLYDDETAEEAETEIERRQYDASDPSA